jgi:hypothetical protein
MTIKERADILIENGEKIKAFKRIFKGRNGKLAMSLLEDICFYNKSTYVKHDPQGTALNEGCRQVLLKVNEFISMDDAEIDKRTEDKLKMIKQIG